MESSVSKQSLKIVSTFWMQKFGKKFYNIGPWQISKVMIEVSTERKDRKTLSKMKTKTTKKFQYILLD